jgi:threonine dehydratase
LAAAALLQGKIDAKGKKVGVVISGGNVDLAWAARQLAR